MTLVLEPCAGCGGLFPAIPNGAVHRYLDSSAACWAAFNALEYPITPFSALIVDAYAVQHPGVPSNQTINSAAIHLMVLYGVFERGYKPEQALWLRTHPGRASRMPKHERFDWLSPPSFAPCLTIADVIAAENQSQILETWIKSVWEAWAVPHQNQVAVWFEKYVLSEQF
jgi:hypothetical protein